MAERLRSLLRFGIVLPLLAVILVVPARVYAQASVEQACQGVILVEGQTCDAGSADSRVSSILKSVLHILSIVVGVAAVVTIIISGLRFITSQGDASNIASARSGLIYALVGLVIVALSQVIARFVLDRL